ncbi:hypothetical protein OAA78_03460 [Flavobacteriaceae bacterium]|nr:hypothetical protein [Flavobacteriaceae bacterium]
MKSTLKYFSIFFSLLCLASCSSIKDPKLVSVDSVSISLVDDNKYTVLTELIIYNPNKFSLSSKDVKLNLFMDSLFLGEIFLLEDFYIKKLDTSHLKTKLILQPQLFKHPINLNDTINLAVEGSAKIPFLPFKYNFDIDHQLMLSDLMNPLLEKNLGESDVNFKAIKIENIRFSSVDITSLLMFKNNFNFDYTIQKLDVEIFDSNKLNNLVGNSSIKSPILVDSQSEVSVESAVSLNTAKLGKSILRNLLKSDNSLFLKANVLIVFNQIQVPLTILKKIDYNPLTQEIKLE